MHVPGAEAEVPAVLDGYLHTPQLLAELKFWVTNLDVSTELVVTNRREAVALAERLKATRHP